MDRQDIAHIFLMFTPMLALAIQPTQIQEESLPNLGDYDGAAMVPYWRSVLDLTYRQYIQFEVKAANDAALLFSERHANTINYSTDTDYVMVTIGGWTDEYSVIRVGSMDNHTGKVDTLDILDDSQFRYFWISWAAGVVKVGHGFELEQNVFMQKPYPDATTDIKYLALFNGWSSLGDWRLYIGV